MKFTSKTLAEMRKAMKRDNAPDVFKKQNVKNKAEPRQSSSTSGCPARHLRPAVYEVDTEMLDYLSGIFNKPAEHLTATSEQNLTQQGVTFVVRALKIASPHFEARLKNYNSLHPAFMKTTH